MKGRAREIALGAVLVVLLFWLLRPAAPAALGPSPAEQKAEQDLQALLDGVLGNLDIEKVTGPVGEYQPGGRNLFDYGVVKLPGPTPEELARAEELRRQQALEEQKRRDEAERLRREALERQRELAEKRAAEELQESANRPPPKPTPPALTLKFMGIVGETADKIAIFLDGEEFLMAREGETVNEHFRVDKISYDTLRIGFTDPRFSEEFRILPLGG